MLEQEILEKWVHESPEDQLRTRQAIHILLTAISLSNELRLQMVMKGGMLMAIKYASHRFTSDIDFSTDIHYRDFNVEEFIPKLDQAIQEALGQLTDYPLAMRVQGYAVQPGQDEKYNFHTMNIRVGYADKNHRSAMSRLENGQSPTRISIDYSFNELFTEVSLGEEADSIQVYGEVTLFAEKFRAILQQKENRKSRGQDIYDLCYFLEKEGFSPDKKETLLKQMVQKASDRHLHIDQHSMRDPEIKQKSQRSYGQLQIQVGDEVLDFEHAYSVLQQFYESLPWQQLNC